jgi:hypothetical protein
MTCKHSIMKYSFAAGYQRRYCVEQARFISAVECGKDCPLYKRVR